MASQLMQEINASVNYDQILYRQDIAGSIAHAEMLADRKILTADDRDQIISGLKQIEQEIAGGAFTFSNSLKIFIMNIETRLAELIGDPAKRLHTARSRNDQVATDLRLWLREAIADIDRMLAGLQAALLNKAEGNTETVMPGLYASANSSADYFWLSSDGLCADVWARPQPLRRLFEAGQ